MKKPTYTPILIIIFLFTVLSANCQSIDMKLSLNDVIIIAKKQSSDAIMAKHRFRNNYWEFQTYKASRKPSLALDGTIPNFNRSISQITQNDGTSIFKEIYTSSYSAGLSLNQNVGLTGGQIFMRSDLQRLDLLGDSIITTYASSPISIGFQQPIFGFNQFKWNKKIQPIKYSEAQKRFLEDVEQLSIKATELFFDMLIAQINFSMANINQANNDTMYKIAKGRYNYGKIAEDELLQMELQLLRSNTQVKQADLDLENATFLLKSFLAIKEKGSLELIPPTELFDYIVDSQKAIEEAKKNSSSTQNYERRLLEAKSTVEKAKRENGFNANLYTTYGLTQTASEISNAYNNPIDRQQVIFGFQVPILDWGQRKGKVKMAESNKELVFANVAQEKLDFGQRIYIQVMQFNMQKQQLEIAAKADTVGQKRYYVTKQRYLIGKIGITDLNIALNEKDAATRNYYSEMLNYWRSYYQLRKLTLYDFKYNMPLIFNFDDVK